jgi:hypothetical protein
MPLTTSHKTLGTVTPTKICDATSIPQTVWVHNSEHSQSDEVFVGNASVSTATGMHIHSEETLKIDLDPGTDLWAISDTDGSILHVMCLKQD